MSWRTDFADAVVTALKAITGIGTVTRDYGEQEADYPSLRVNFSDETYDRTLGNPLGVVNVGFTVFGRIQRGDSDRYDDLDDFLDDVIEAMEGITAYNTIILENTVFHERVSGERLSFEVSGSVTLEKDYSSM